MKKEHIRSYRIDETSDIRVTHWNKGEVIDLSAKYALRYDRHAVRHDSAIDVFRLEDGTLAWFATPAGHDAEAARSLWLLLGMFVEDTERSTGDPLCF